MSSKIEDDEMRENITEFSIGDPVVVIKKGQFHDQKGYIHCKGVYVGVQLENGVHIRAKYNEVKLTK